jgi:hypothetical protein
METGLGLEGTEPVDLYQFSHARGRPHTSDSQNGGRVVVEPNEQVEASISVLSGARDQDDTDLENPGIEAQVKGEAKRENYGGSCRPARRQTA